MIVVPALRPRMNDLCGGRPTAVRVDGCSATDTNIPGGSHEVEDRRNRPAIFLDATLRSAMCHTLSARLPLYVVTEYPKSGGTWLGQLLSAVLKLPFPRNRLPELRPSIMHGHYLPSRRIRNLFCMLRDGRDTVISYYHHALSANDTTSPTAVQRARAASGIMDPTDVRRNLPRFIEYIHDRETRSHSPFRFTWSAYVRASVVQRSQWPIVRYESLLADTAGALADAVDQVTGRQPDHDLVESAVAEYSFQNQTGRAPGNEQIGSFLRRGTSGEWRAVFTREAAELFDAYHGESLMLAGYEADRAWVQDCDP